MCTCSKAHVYPKSEFMEILIWVDSPLKASQQIQYSNNVLFVFSRSFLNN
jgi:hypothetical protein